MSFKKILYVTLIFLLTLSCKDKNKETDNIFKFRKYINYTTSGIVSTTSSVTISLAKDVKNWEEDKKLSKEIFSISPNVAGELVAKNQHKFQFIPSEKLASDTEYSVTVNLGKIYKNISSEFKKYTFQFKTIKPNFTINTGNLQSYDKNYQYLIGAIKSADAISLNQAKELVNVYQQNEEINVVFNESFENGTTFEFKIDSIKRLEDDSELVVKWNGNAIKSDFKGENLLTIPGKNNFKIVNISAKQNTEQFVSINFSDPLETNQNFDGLI